ncbi:phosphatase PAP2 family protein [Romboutsia weinsteinii]|uniref:Phosphatase PAP2 family protein n=2 Tax=Romboutsia weinsteinii TaxID=2020949 RepID=A0A371J734_9FIRM|nr:phosphatase PAP2 family protein [Romboutsia weinsteinii]
MDIQLSILQFFQSMRSPLLNVMFLVFTISTETPVVVLFTVMMYWCINKKYGQRILFALVGNITLNTGIKEFVKAPRPIGTKDLESLRVSTATGYSFPSGHTQTGTSFWVSLMSIFKVNWLYILGTIMILGVGISRLYLVVHWPIDVLFGWIFGIIFTLLLGKVFDYVDKEKNYSILLFILILFGVIAFFLNSIDYMKMFGLFTGFVLGYIVEDKFVDFSTEDKTKGRINFGSRTTKRSNRMAINIYRFIVGIITLGLVYIGLKYLKEAIMPYIVLDNMNLVNMIMDYIRYALVVFYGVAGAPALFKILRLN